MASIPGAVLICASSPYARRGALWDAFRRHWGKVGAPLVWRATTREMNPGIRQSVIDNALERDTASASAEYLAEFRSDIEAFVTREVVEACVAPGTFERPYTSGIRYRAFVDPSGGSNDAMTLAIGHRQEPGGQHDQPDRQGHAGGAVQDGERHGVREAIHRQMRGQGSCRHASYLFRSRCSDLSFPNRQIAWAQDPPDRRSPPGFQHRLARGPGRGPPPARVAFPHCRQLTA
jgi:hypothetical protein